ncbi:MAG: NUDIX domain-containing protein [Patescibacteria group bacterium]
MTEMTQSAGGIVLNQAGEIALVKNGPSFWGFPKGHLDEGEEAISAALREIEEETGLTALTTVAELGYYERYRGTPDGSGDDTSELKRIHMFLFTTAEERLAPIDSSNPEARWVKKEEVASLLSHPKDREFFESMKSRLS